MPDFVIAAVVIWAALLLLQMATQVIAWMFFQAFGAVDRHRSGREDADRVFDATLDEEPH